MTACASSRPAIATGLVDLADTEISNGETMIEEVRQACRQNGTRLILSYHDFDKTPSEAFITDRLCTARDLGADVAKVAVMPNNYRGRAHPAQCDVYRQDRTARHPEHHHVHGRRRGHHPHRRRALRVRSHIRHRQRAGSAPGQIPIIDLKKAWSALSFE